MAQYAILIYGPDSGHAPDAKAQDLEVYDRHADDGGGLEIRPVAAGGPVDRDEPGAG